jgi:hypothetical protein
MRRQIERLASMKAVFLAVMIVFCLMPAPAAGKEAMDGTIGWPSGAGGWKKTGEAVRYAGRQIFDYMDGAGEVFLAYNFKTLTVRRFEREAHPGLVAELYEMGGPADAFGVFSFDRQDPEAGIGQGSEFGGGLLRFWKGRHFVSVYGEGEGKEQEQAVLEIGRKLASSIVETGEPPRLIRALPEERRVEGSAGFVRSHVLLNQRCFISYENILGLGADTEAVFARYDFGKEKTFALIVAYPDEAKARNAFAGFKKAYALDAEGMARPGGNRAWTGAEAQGTCIIIALNAPNSETVRRLIEAAKLKLKEAR